ncbi:MAG: single-stranded DNA-binding protein [bacterium]
MNLQTISKKLSKEVDTLAFAEPVTHVYNPLDYAWNLHAQFLELYGDRGAKILLLGMNPGPWGMAQTGVPFGEVGFVRDWMKLEGEVKKPKNEHPKRPIDGLTCSRSEVSGARLWGWGASTFGTPEAFFDKFFVWNYCPLSFMEESGRNKTPDKLPVEERDALFAVCDRWLDEVVKTGGFERVIGVGAFAEQRARKAVTTDVEFGRILHPSPASPKANAGWEEAIVQEFAEMGVSLTP